MNKMISFYKRALEFFRSYSHKFSSVAVIKTVEYHYEGMVYNLSVADDETYIADGFVVHNCRSRRVPVVKEEFAIKGLVGERPAVGDKRGTVRGDVDYGTFLKRQSKEFQLEFFEKFPGDPGGLQRQKLFKSGGLTIDRFRDETGKTYSIDELNALNPLAFDKAGLTDSPLRS